jgi:hypothetical protein
MVMKPVQMYTMQASLSIQYNKKHCILTLPGSGCGRIRRTGKTVQEPVFDDWLLSG